MPALDLSSYRPSAGDLGDAVKIYNAFTGIQATINALDASNFAAGKIFDLLKLQQGGAITGQGLVWNGTDWVASSAIANVIQRKNTPTSITNSVLETDLIPGFSVPANTHGTTRCVRMEAWGDYAQTSGVTTVMPRFKVKAGSGPTVLLDTGTSGAAIGSSASRMSWRIIFDWLALNATNAQWASIAVKLGIATATAQSAAFTTGEGKYGVSGSGIGEGEGGIGTAIDTTATQQLQLTCINPSAATTDIVCKGALLSVL